MQLAQLVAKGTPTNLASPLKYLASFLSPLLFSLLPSSTSAPSLLSLLCVSSAFCLPLPFPSLSSFLPLLSFPLPPSHILLLAPPTSHLTMSKHVECNQAKFNICKEITAILLLLFTITRICSKLVVGNQHT